MRLAIVRSNSDPCACLTERKPQHGQSSETNALARNVSADHLAAFIRHFLEYRSHIFALGKNTLQSGCCSPVDCRFVSGRDSWDPYSRNPAMALVISRRRRAPANHTLRTKLHETIENATYELLYAGRFRSTRVLRTTSLAVTPGTGLCSADGQRSRNLKELGADVGRIVVLWLVVFCILGVEHIVGIRLGLDGWLSVLFWSAAISGCWMVASIAANIVLQMQVIELKSSTPEPDR